jgi:hypothetical protein
MGIILRFYSNDHSPIHVHAIYGKNVVKVELIIKNGDLQNMKLRYMPVKGVFPPAKLKELKYFMSYFKIKVFLNWQRYFILNMRVKKEVITKTKFTSDDKLN